MKIAIIGPGATGCLFASLLTEAGHSCHLIDKNSDRADFISRNGIRIEGIGGKRHINITSSLPENYKETPELTIVCVKAFDTEQAVISAKQFIRPDTVVLSLQNGLGNLEAMQKHLPNTSLLAGTTTQGATLLNKAQILHAGKGETIIGSHSDHALAIKITELLNNADIPATATDSLTQTLWSKLIINSAIGPVTALSGLRNGEILEQPHWNKLLINTALESASVAIGSGITLVYEDPAKAVTDVCRVTAANYSSMLQDVRAGRRTEIDAINGMIIEQAEQNNLESPLNRYLLTEIQAKTG
ncbi:MAG: 2-dehydropantoate 2-reductase [Lentisphaerae bacterium]|jgi:2-dehydropantoate 2-reductase|nr:2-dehydropantoate 2-reductase [Lentisphaerota bacterium]